MTYSTHLLRHLRLTIGQNIHRLRRDKKMPLGILSGLSGLPREKIDHYELGKNEITLDHMLRIACALETDVSVLLK
ncbi:MAG: helix-turn-helix transcriptional regulator [Alphaproteobacteria bacterium]